MNTHSSFKTSQARRYLGTLCKHFGHKVPVLLNGDHGRIELPFGQCALAASDSALEIEVSANTKTELDKATQVIASHLERFAFRENPNLIWDGADN